MRIVILALAVAIPALAQSEKLVFPAKPGDVTFNHAAHIDRTAMDCGACHEKFFPQSNAPLNYKGDAHKAAEAAKSSCGGCHYPGGEAFESQGNCGKCHAH
jgi:c(7)-type cytochrome triheme protein